MYNFTLFNYYYYYFIIYTEEIVFNINANKKSKKNNRTINYYFQMFFKIKFCMCIFYFICFFSKYFYIERCMYRYMNKKTKVKMLSWKLVLVVCCWFWFTVENQLFLRAVIFYTFFVLFFSYTLLKRFFKNNIKIKSISLYFSIKNFD